MVPPSTAWLVSSFRSPADRQAFAAHTAALTLEWWPRLGLAVAAAAVLWWPLDRVLYADAPEALVGLRDMRLGLLLINPVLSLLGPKVVGRLPPWGPLLGAFLAGVADLALAGFALGSLDGGGIPGLTYAFVAPQFSVLLLLPLTWRVGASVAYTATVVLAWWLHPGSAFDQPGVAASVSFLVFSTGLSVFLGHVVYALLRRGFALAREVEEQRVELVGLTARLEDRVAEQTAALRALHERARDARVEERSQIARDLHDSLGQELISLRLLVGVGRQVHAAPEVLDTLAELEGQVERVQKSVRGVLEALGPPRLEEVGLVEALAGLVADLERRSGLRMALEARAVPAALPPDVALAAYRVVQEALNNVLRHARASAVAVRLTGGPGALDIEVRDDGRGIAPERVRAGLGTRGIQERAEALGGSARWDLEPAGGGTRMTVHLPLGEAP